MMKKFNITILLFSLFIILPAVLEAELYPDTVIPLEDNSGYAFFSREREIDANGNPLGTDASPQLETRLVIADTSGRKVGSLPIYSNPSHDEFEGGGIADARALKLNRFKNGDLFVMFLRAADPNCNIYFRVYHRDSSGRYSADDALLIGTTGINDFVSAATVEETFYIVYTAMDSLVITIRQFDYMSDYPDTGITHISETSLTIDERFSSNLNGDIQDSYRNDCYENDPQTIKYINSTGEEEFVFYYTNFTGNTYQSETITEDDILHEWEKTFYERGNTVTGRSLEGKVMSETGVTDALTLSVCGIQTYMGPLVKPNLNFFKAVPRESAPGYFVEYVSTGSIYGVDYEESVTIETPTWDVIQQWDIRNEWFRPGSSCVALSEGPVPIAFSELFTSEIQKIGNGVPNDAQDPVNTLEMETPVTSGVHNVSHSTILQLTDTYKTYYSTRGVFNKNVSEDPRIDTYIVSPGAYQLTPDTPMPSRFTDILTACHQNNGKFFKAENSGKWSDLGYTVYVSIHEATEQIVSGGQTSVPAMAGNFYFYYDTGMKLLYPEGLWFPEGGGLVVNDGVTISGPAISNYTPGLGIDGVMPMQSVGGGAQVNLITGNLFYEKELFSISSALPWGMSLYYNSTMSAFLEKKWRHSFDYELAATLNGLVFKMPDGREILFNVPDPANDLTDENADHLYYPDRKNGFDGVLSWNQGGTSGVGTDDDIVVTVGHSMKFHFQGRPSHLRGSAPLKRVEDASGNVWNLSESSGVTTVTGPCGREVEIASDTITLKVPTGVASDTTDYTYSLTSYNSGLGNLEEIIWPGGRTVSFEYSKISDRMTALTDESGNEFTFAYWGEDYDTGWNSISEYAETDSETVGFGSDGKVKRVETPMPNQNVDPALEPAGSKYAWKFLYGSDADGVYTIVRDRTNFDTTYYYNEEWMVPEKTTYTCDVNEPNIAVPGKELFETLYSWDIGNANKDDDYRRMVSITDVVGKLTSYSYADNDNPLKSTQVSYTMPNPGFQNAVGESVSAPAETFVYYNSSDSLYPELRGLLKEYTDVLGYTVSYDYYSDEETGGPVRKVQSISRDMKTSPISGVNEVTITEYTYNSKGLLLTETADPDGDVYVVNYEYTGTFADLLSRTWAVDPSGGTSRMNPYDPAFGLDNPYDFTDNEELFQYDDFGNPTRKTDAEGAYEMWEYYASGTEFGMLRLHTAKTGKQIFYEYDFSAADTVYSSTCMHSVATVSSYISTADLSSGATPTGLLSSSFTEYDYTGNPVKSTDALGNSETVYRDGEGRAVSSEDKNGNTSESLFYDNGLVKETTTSNITDGYTGEDLPESVSQFKYDRMGNVIETRAATAFDTEGEVSDWRTMYYAYNNYGWKTSESYNASFVSPCRNYKYNINGWLTEETDWVGRIIMKEPEFTETGAQVVSKRMLDSTRAQVTHYTYDNRGRLVETVEDPGGADRISETVYDISGKVTQQISAKGTDDEMITYYYYDSRGRQVESVLGNIQTVTYYDDAGNVTRKEQWGGSGSSARRRTYSAVYDYNSNGNLVSEQGQGLRVASYGYDAMGRVVSTTYSDVTGSTTTDYDAMGRVYYTCSAEGRETFTDFDAFGRVTAQTEAGQTTRYFYTPDGLLESTLYPQITLPDDNTVFPVTMNAYDPVSRQMISSTRGFVDSDSHRPELSDLSEAVTTRTVEKDDNFVTTKVINVNGDESLVNDIDGDRTVDPDERTLMGHTLKSRNVNGQLKTSTVNSLGQTTHLADTLSNTTTYGFDNAGRGTGRTLEDPNNTTSKTYTSEGWLDTVTDGNGTTLKYTYFPFGDLSTIIDNSTSEILRVFVRDDQGRVLQTVEYNDTSTAADNVVVTYDYYPNSDRLRYEALTVGSISAKVEYEYDNDGRLVKIKYPHEDTSAYTYQKEINYTYTTEGFIESIYFDSVDSVDPFKAVEYSYDGDRVSGKTLGGSVLTYLYKSDQRDFLKSMQVSSAGGGSTSARHLTYQRKNDGRITSITDLVSDTIDEDAAFTYGDDMGILAQGYRLMSVMRGSKVEDFDYDIMGNELGTPQWTAIEELTNSEIHSWADLDAYILDGHWWRTDQNLNTANDNLWANIRLIHEDKSPKYFETTVKTASNELYKPVLARMYFLATDTDNYNFAGLRTKLVAVDDSGDKVIQMVHFEIGSVVSGTETILETTQIGLDVPVNTFRLALVSKGDKAMLQYTAGAQTGAIQADMNMLAAGKAGFITHKAGGYAARFTDVLFETGTYEDGCVLTSPIYQYTSYSGKTCTWDKNGNLTQYGADNFEYDAFNRMTKANGTKYLYDANNRRVAKTDSGGTITDIYVYHGWSVIQEYDGTGNLRAEYVDGTTIDEHLMMVDHTGTAEDKYFYILDHNNSVSRIVDDSGDLVERYEYTGYGEPTIFDINNAVAISSISLNPYRFHGRRLDTESNLMYFRNRQYSPEMKRFISMDPLGYAISMNMYETFCCDPTNYIDPSGEAGYFFDGTGNHPGETNFDGSDNYKTNVRMLFESYDTKNNGRKYYAYGIGSGYTVDGKEYPFFDIRTMRTRMKRIRIEGATGDTMHSRVKHMMGILESELSKGTANSNKVDVFGFSRGAASVLVFLNWIQEEIRNGDNPLYGNVEVRFVGLFDSVSYIKHFPALGLRSGDISSGRSKEFKFSLPADMDFKNTPVHLVSLDETRKQFRQHNLENAHEVGFRGKHSDIGGGYGPDNKLDWVPRYYMVKQAEKAGVEFNKKILWSFDEVGKHRLLLRNAQPTENDEWYFDDKEPRKFSKNMYIHPSVYWCPRQSSLKKYDSFYHQLGITEPIYTHKGLGKWW